MHVHVRQYRVVLGAEHHAPKRSVDRPPRMIISSRSPEGQPFRCPVCHEDTELEPSSVGDACCPACGTLLGWFRDRIDERLQLSDSFDVANIGSLEFVELVMQLEAEFGLNLSEAAAEEIQTIEDAIRALRRQWDRQYE